ncbi:MAG: TMAO reductase system periplasmic protein TorT [Clostridiaceae bacterium]
MKIQKYVNRKSLLLFIFSAAILTFIFTYIKREKSETFNNTVEKTMIDDVTKAAESKSGHTVETYDSEISTKIGEQELTVNSYYGVYDSSKKKTGCSQMGSGKSLKEKWVSVKPIKEYNISVLMPHFEDDYWKAANYGIINYAKELGVKIKLYSVGGYIEIGNQKEQLQTLAKDSKVDGIIFAALDNTKFDSDVANLDSSGKPVVELINDINAPEISAKAVVPYYEMGYKAGESVIKDAAGKDVNIAFFPGPEGSGWAPDTYYGFKDAIADLKKENQKIDISDPYYGDTRPEVQLLRVASVLKKNNDYDYVVGCAPAVLEAEKFIAVNKENFKNTKIVSTYITGEVYNLILKGTVLASPSDQTIEQCRIALDMLVRILNGEKPGVDFPFRSGPEIPVITRNNISKFKYEDLFEPRDYTLVINQMSEQGSEK